ncbi:hypothetical protein K504DRAFT_351583, partial [Pleomassaria siparia CBS 279.74]
AGLVSMPIELLVYKIANHLSTTDLGSLRRTCRVLERTLFDSFAKEFFTKKQFMLTTPSLSALVDISKHKELSKHLKHVIIGLEQYPTLDSGVYSGPMDHTRRQRCFDGQADQISLTQNGGDRAMLADAFRHLTHLETLGIRDYNNRHRPRERARWNSYGATTVRRETGIEFFCDSHTAAEFAAKVYKLLFLALGDAQTSVPSIEVILRKPSVGLDNVAFYLLPYSLPNVIPVLENLHQLLLTIRLKSQRVTHLMQPVPFGQPDPPTPRNRQLYLAQFLGHAKNLTHLRLNMQQHEYDACTEVLQTFSDPNTPLLLPRLEKIELGMMRINPDLLLQVVTRFATTLRFLGFWKLSLRYTRSTYRSEDNKPNVWANLLCHISKVPGLNLTGMALGYIGQ